MICKRCGGKWEPRVKEPRYCPLCKSPAWNRERKAEPIIHLSEVGIYPISEIEALEIEALAIPVPEMEFVHASIPQDSPAGRELRKTLLMKEPGPKHPARCACQDCTFIRKYGKKSTETSK